MSLMICHRCYGCSLNGGVFAQRALSSGLSLHHKTRHAGACYPSSNRMSGLALSIYGVQGQPGLPQDPGKRERGEGRKEKKNIDR